MKLVGQKEVRVFCVFQPGQSRTWGDLGGPALLSVTGRRKGSESESTQQHDWILKTDLCENKSSKRIETQYHLQIS
jgi:hypothetical protein